MPLCSPNYQFGAGTEHDMKRQKRPETTGEKQTKKPKQKVKNMGKSAP